MKKQIPDAQQLKIPFPRRKKEGTHAMYDAMMGNGAYFRDILKIPAQEAGHNGKKRTDNKA